MKSKTEGADEHEESYGEEILNASWLPETEVPLGAVRSAAADERHPPVAAADTAEFLKSIYRNQE